MIVLLCKPTWPDDNSMHVRPDLRGFFLLARFSFRFGDRGRCPANRADDARYVNA